MLGDSITYAGNYVTNFESWLTLTFPKQQLTVINVGLSSETVSGLSEDGHAGGRFPRPDLHERLDRVLTKTNPDLIFACYGMNCGIYQPLGESRFEKYKEGIKKLKAKAEAAGSKIVFITPPYFDGNKDGKEADYTNVLRSYSAWLVSQRENGWHVIDLNSHMEKSVLEMRKTTPDFTYQKDHVHPNDEGHWVMTQPILAWFGDHASAKCKTAQDMLTQLGSIPEMHPLITQRSQLLRDAWLTETGHKRPSFRKGLPLDEAKIKASEITKALNVLR